LAQNTAEDLHAQSDIDATRTALSPNAPDVASLGNKKPRPDAAKTEISAGFAEVSGKVAHLRPKGFPK
jgi:hypothetical protein